MKTRRTPRGPVLRALPAALALLGATALAGCSELEDAARDTASDAACQAVQEAVDGVSGEARRAVDEIGADPAAARQELTGLRDAVTAAEENLSGDAQQHLDDARAALDSLVQQAENATEGTEVDDVVVEDAQRELDTAVEEASQVC